MNRKSFCVIRTCVVAVCLLLTAAFVNAQSFPAGFQATRLATGLNPTDMKFSPDGVYLFIADKSGKIFLMKNDVFRTTEILNITSLVDPFNERGFNHIALDPQFASNGYIYVYYTMRTIPARCKVARYTFDFNTETIGTTEFQLLQLDAMTGDIHTGGAMVFGPDGKLYVTTGESSDPNKAQDLTTTLGKVLRLNKEGGGAPADNPYFGVAGVNPYIYALGFRNPFSMDVQPGTGRIFIGDVGQTAFEEINELARGKNYGWRPVEGPLPNGVTPPADYQDPFFAYAHDQGCAIIGAAFYNPTFNGFPASYQGKFFYADYCNLWIRTLDLTTKTWSNFGTNVGRPVSLAIRPSTGAFYYIDRGGIPHDGSTGSNTSTNLGQLWRVTYTGSLVPTIAAHPDPVTASVNTNASFNVVANGLQLTYQWLRNGNPISGATNDSYTLNNVQLSDNGATFSCRVTNGHGNVTSNTALLTVTNRPPPEPVITLPAAGATYIAGQTYAFSGSATDATDGALPASKLTWQIDFHHDDHTHPGLPETPGNLVTGQFAISQINEVSDNVWYRFYLTAENNIGIRKTIFRDMLPQKVNLNFVAPPGVAINVDGTSTPAPASVRSVKGIIRFIQAPQTYIVVDTMWQFVRWGNGSTNRNLQITTPNSDTTITAVYTRQAQWSGNGLSAKYYNRASSPPAIPFTGSPVLTRTDPTINFSWTGGTASPGPGVQQDNFGVSWTGFIQPRTSGTYTFYVVTNDGVRLFVNGQPLINNQWSNGDKNLTATMVLTGGAQYSIQMDMYDASGLASAQLSWSGPGVLKQVIPQNAMFTEMPGALPVRFIAFDVKPQTDGLNLVWMVEDLGNTKEYTVERSSDGSEFEDIGTIPSTGGSSYSFKDRSAAKNILYQYRIRQTDLDGRFMFSQIRTGLLSSNSQFDFIVTPNPVTNNRVAQLVFTKSPGVVDVQIISTSGSTLISKRVQSISGQTMYLPLERVPRGTYFVKVIYEGKVITKRIVLQ